MKQNPGKVTARQLLSLLEQRHHDDVFVPECKDGPTWGAEHLRMDAWAMPRSWSHFSTIAYEIKVSRSDFLKDSKLIKYQAYSNELYVVAPPGIIEPSELSEAIGLLVSSTNGTRLYTKRKAVFRDVVPPWKLFAYILMSRAQITQPGFNQRTSTKQYWEGWLRQREIDHDFGRRVGTAVREEIEKKIQEVRRENENLKSEIASLKEVRETVQSLGIEITRYGTRHVVRRRLEELRTGLPFDLENALHYADMYIQELQQLLRMNGLNKSTKPL